MISCMVHSYSGIQMGLKILNAVITMGISTCNTQAGTKMDIRRRILLIIMGN